MGCREGITLFKTDYQKAREENFTFGNLSSACFFYDVDQVLRTAQNTEPSVLHDSPVSWGGKLLALESTIGLEWS